MLSCKAEQAVGFKSKRSFEALSWSCFPNRTTKELVIHYYTRHKQARTQFGEPYEVTVDADDNGTYVDPPGSMPPTVSELKLWFGCADAVTDEDGFPVSGCDRLFS